MERDFREVIGNQPNQYRIAPPIPELIYCFIKPVLLAPLPKQMRQKRL